MYNKIINQELSFKEIMQLKNIEYRMIALKYSRLEDILKANATLINVGTKGVNHFIYDSKNKWSNKVTYNELYLVKGIFNQDAYFLKYEDPSTGRVYISGVDPVIGKKGDADECLAWKFSISKEEYLSLNVQT